MTILTYNADGLTCNADGVIQRQWAQRRWMALGSVWVDLHVSDPFHTHASPTGLQAHAKRSRLTEPQWVAELACRSLCFEGQSQKNRTPRKTQQIPPSPHFYRQRPCCYAYHATDPACSCKVDLHASDPFRTYASPIGLQAHAKRR